MMNALTFETGQGAIRDLLQLLAAQDCVSYRMVCVQPPRSSWLIHAMVVDVLPADAAHPSAFSYEYRDVHALGGQVTGAAIVTILQKGGKLVNVSHPLAPDVTYSFGMPSLADTDAAGGLTWYRFPSRSSESIMPLLWPHTRYELPIQNYSRVQVPRHLLINEGCPFFPDVESLIADRIYGVPREHVPGTRLSDPAIVVRVADARSWLDRVAVSTSSILVSVRGADLHDVRLHTSGVATVEPEIDLGRDDGGAQVGQGEQRSITLPLVGEAPPSFQLLLAHKADWRDYRVVPTQWLPFHDREPGVTISPPDLRAQIEAYIYQGEGPRVEFKHQPPQDANQKERMLKTVAAFANGAGGVILLGVEDNSGVVVGIDTKALPKGSVLALRDALVDMVRATVIPEPQIDMQHCEIDGKLVLVLYVDAGSQRPYGLNPAKTVFYVRRGATTFPARPDEVRALVAIVTEGAADVFGAGMLGPYGISQAAEITDVESLTMRY